MRTNKFYETTIELINEIEETQEKNIEKVAAAITQTIKKGGIIQAFGSGHSNAGALEITHRAGGYIPTKNIKEPASGAYETLPNVGNVFMKKVDIRENDIVFVISTSGWNPLPIEVALESQKRGAKVVAVTSIKASQNLESKHESGKNLYEIADLVLDTRIIEGDSSINIDGLETKVIGMSSIGTNVVIQAAIFRSIEMLIEMGITPPIYKSQNIEGGREFNESLEKEYLSRLYRI